MTPDTQHALNAIFDIADATPTSPTSNVALVEVSPSPTPTEDLTPEEREAHEDYAFSRGALKSLAVEAQQTLHRAVEVAELTDKSSAFTAVAELLRATLETHRDLQQLHKTSAEIKVAKATSLGAGSVNIQQGVVFNGTPAELLKLVDPTRQ